MSSPCAPPPLSERDQRLVAALQCDGRVTAERAATVLGLGTRDVQRRLRSLVGDGTVRVLARRVRHAGAGASLLRVRVLRGRLDALTAALADREDVPFVDVSASGDEISAVLLHSLEPRNRLIFSQLPATRAVTSVTAQTVLHVFSEAADWRLDVLTEDERADLEPLATPLPAGQAPAALDAVDEAIAGVLDDDARAPASAVADLTGCSESTVRRRMASMFADGRLGTEVVVDPQRLGMRVDANIWMEVAPDHLDSTGRALAGHPAVHGTLATTGRANLCVAVWFRDMAELYRFLSQDLSGRGVTATETVLTGQWIKRAGIHRRNAAL